MGTWIAIEAKKYRENTAFKPGELQFKLTQIYLQQPHPDVWVIVASRPVSDQVMSQLRTIAAREGIEVEIIDAPKGDLGDLDALVASEPGIALRYLKRDLSTTLMRIAAEPTFEIRKRALHQRLSAPLLGFDHVRSQASGWFGEALADPFAARSRLGQSLVPFAPDVHYIRRAGADAALDDWWSVWPTTHSPLVLLGEEGVGKTWAVATWAKAALEHANNTILLFASSRDIASTRPEELIRMAISNALGEASLPAEYWERRLANWRGRSTGGAPLFLLIADGINERPSFAWRELFDRLRGSPWHDRVAVLVTSRPGYWDDAKFMPGQVLRTWTLAPFDGQELDAALQASGHTRADFDHRLLPLLHKPRYFSLAVRHYARLEATGDFTLDRLLYEDWKDRLSSKTQLKLDDQDFRDLLGELAKAYRNGRERFTRRELQDLLPKEAIEDLTELVTGGLVVVDRGLTQTFKVDTGWLVHSLGLLLASQLAKDVESETLKEELSKYLEPHLEVDQQGDILAAANLYALFTADYPPAARLALLHAWVTRQNHSQASVDRLRAYVPIAVEGYLELLEAGCLGGKIDSRAIERIEYALLSWRDLPTVVSALGSRSVRWLGLVHPLGFPYMRPRPRKGEELTPRERETIENVRRAVEERAGASVQAGRALRPTGSDVLEVTASDNFTRLADCALFLLSAIPEKYLPKALRTWALSRAVMGYAGEWTEVAWLVRRAATDEFEKSFLEEMEPLLRHPNSTVLKAGRELLNCLGTPHAITRLSMLQPAMPRIGELADEGTSDPCTKWSWRREDCGPCADRQDLTDLMVVRNLAAHCIDPGFLLPKAALGRIRSALEHVDLSKAWGDLEDIEPAAAVAAPTTVVAAYREVVRTQARHEEGWQGLAHQLHKVHPLLGRRESEILADRLHAISQGMPRHNNQLRVWESQFFAATIVNAPPLRQLDAFLTRPDWALNTVDLLEIFRALRESEVSAFLGALATNTGIELERKLTFLLAQPQLALTHESEEFLCSLLSAENSREEHPCHFLAVQILLRLGGPRSWSRAILGTRMIPGDVVWFRERWPNEEKFLAFNTVIDYSSLRTSIDLASLSYVLAASDRLSEDLEHYAIDVDTRLREERRGRSDPLHPRFRVPFSSDLLRAVVQAHPKLVAGWLELVTAEDLDWKLVNFVKSTFPLYEALCEALYCLQDGRAQHLYETLDVCANQQQQSFFRDRIGHGLPLLLMRLDTDDVLPSRRDWYRRCWRDAILLDFACVARSYDRGEFLVDLVEEGLRSANAIEKAKAISLSGWSGVSQRLTALLEGLEFPSDSWFALLQAQALRRIRLERWGRHWFSRFLGASGTAKSFAAFRLFLRCVDRRYYVWRDELVVAQPVTAPLKERMRSLEASHDEIAKAIERNETTLDKTYLHLGVPDRRLAPWTGLPDERSSRASGRNRAAE